MLTMTPTEVMSKTRQVKKADRMTDSNRDHSTTNILEPQLKRQVVMVQPLVQYDARWYYHKAYW